MVFQSKDSLVMIKTRNENEKLDEATLERVISYLETKGATKKNACIMMNISYNTARLDRLIEAYKTKKEADAKRRAEKRGKPATKEEVSFIISEYLAGQPVDTISKNVYRGTAFIKSILSAYSVPERNISQDYFRPKLIPEEAVREEFSIGELVYSAKYDTIAIIEKELVQNNIKVYRIYLKGDWLRHAFQPAYELASLQSIRDLGVAL